MRAVFRFAKISKALPGLICCLALHACSPGQDRELNVAFVTEFPDLLEESSALAIADEVVWTLNDSGNTAVLFALSLQGQILAEVPIGNARNVDWESLAQDESHFFVADTGNNLNSRDRLVIYRIPKPRLNSENIAAEFISIRYAGYKSGNMSSHNFDAEALAVRGDELWLFSKNRGMAIQISIVYQSCPEIMSSRLANRCPCGHWLQPQIFIPKPLSWYSSAFDGKISACNL